MRSIGGEGIIKTPISYLSSAMDATSTLSEREQRLITQYGELLSVKEIAEVFKYSSPASVRKAHELGHLPVKLRKFQNRRGFFATAKAVAAAIAQIDDDDD